MNVLEKVNAILDGVAALFGLIGVAAIAGFAVNSSPILVLGGIVAFILAAAPLFVRVIRPKQNHLVVISDFTGYAQRAVPSGEIGLYLRWAEYPSDEVGMTRRTAKFELEDVLTEDGHYFDILVEVYYIIDLSRVDMSTLREMCSLKSEMGWQGIVGKISGGVIREYWAVHNSAFFLEARNHATFCRELSHLVSAQVRQRGIIVLAPYGVSIREWPPTPQVRDAMKKGKSLEIEGRATAQLLEILSEATRGDRELTMQMLYLQLLASQNLAILPMWGFNGRGGGPTAGAQQPDQPAGVPGR